MLNAGADKVSINTAAVTNPEFVREAADRFGSQCIVVAIDAKKVSQEGEPDRWEIFTHGGAARQAWMPSSGPGKWSSSAQASYC